MACSYCGSVEAPAWFSSSALWALVAVLALVGTVAGIVGLTRDRWPGRPGALCLGLGLAVLLPAAAVLAHSGGTRVDVEVEGRAPVDGDAWSVRCETFQEPAAAGNELQEAFVEACASATRPARWTAVVLALAAGMLAVDGVRRPMAARVGPRKLDDASMRV